MILVQSLRQLLSGNKKFFLFALSLLILASCGGTKKTVSNKNNNGNISRSDSRSKKDNKVDTIKWTRVSKTEVPPITGKNSVIKSTKKDIYSISILLPFGSRNFDFDSGNIDTDSDHLRFINYYAGIKMALKDLESADMKFNVNVFDSEATGSSVASILNLPSLQNSDVIIGPYTSDNLKLVASFGKRNEIPVISPWRASPSITDENPYYVQLRPNLKSYYQTIIADALNDYSADQIFLIGRETESDQKRIDRLQSYVKDIQGPTAVGLNEFVVNEDSLQIGVTAFDSIFIEDQTTVIIIPNWSFRADESFIYSCLRKLNAEKGMHDVVVYGMPIMIDSEQMDFNFYRNLNMRVARSKYVDSHRQNIKDFKRKYFSNYSDIPTDDAYEGYDVMNLVAKNIFTHGTSFQYFLTEDKKEYLQMSFDIQKRIDNNCAEYEDDEFSYFENMHLDIYEFVNDRFIKKLRK
jgi:ABC-type branched-subunit amino acid transport system substrate-binding protein